VAKRYILQQTCLNKWVRNFPHEQHFTTQSFPSNCLPGKFRNFTYSSYLAFFITWFFVYVV